MSQNIDTMDEPDECGLGGCPPLFPSLEDDEVEIRYLMKLDVHRTLLVDPVMVMNLLCTTELGKFRYTSIRYPPF